MRIAFLTNNRFPPREGVARHVFEIGLRLQRRGHEVTILARGLRLSWREHEVEGLRVLDYPSLPLPMAHHLLARQALGGWLDAGADGAELLHVHLPLLPPLRTGLRTIATFHSPMLADTAAVRGPGLKPKLIRLNARLLSRRFEAWYLEHAHEVVAVSRGVRHELARLYRPRRTAISVIPNGVDTGYFAFTPAKDRAGLLYAGRLGYRKGLARLLGAFADLGRSDLTLSLAGEGPLEAELRAQAKRLGIEGRTRFLGFLDRAALRQQLAAAACFVNPADYESGPLTLLEAMAAGTPVVSTPTGLAAELGLDAPILRCPAEPAALAQAINAVLDDPDAAAARARRARDLVVAEFDWERVVDRLQGLYAAPQRLAA